MQIGKLDIIIQQFLELRLRLQANQLKEMFPTVLHNVVQIQMHAHTQAVIFFPDLKGFQEEQLGHVYY